MAKPQITEAVLANGQNEGVERSILPLPQLAVVQNARQRKTGRWGKRYGTKRISDFDSSGNTIGNGTGNRRCIGPGFCSIDDKAYVYDQNGAKWVDPTRVSALNSSSDAFVTTPRVPGVVSGWLPDTAYLPVPPLSQQRQKGIACAQAYCIGYLWHAITFTDPQNSSDTMIRVAATNPTDNTVVFVQDIRASVAAQGGVNLPKLVTCGSTLILSYTNRLGNAARAVNGRRLTNVATGFGSEVALDGNLNATGIFDASSFSATQMLLATSLAAGATVRLQLIDSTTLGSAANINYVDASPVIYGASVVGSSGQPIYLTVAAHNGAGPVDTTKVAVYTTSLGSLTGTVTVDSTTNNTQAYSVVLPGGGVRCVYGYTTTGAEVTQKFSWVDVTATPTIATSTRLTQYRYTPISKPFAVGTQVYMWVGNTDILQGLGYATLLRIPALAEFPGTGPGTATYPEVTCPLELSAQDFLISQSIFSGGTAFTLTAPTQIGATAGWAFLVASYSTVPDPNVTTAHEFRTIQAKHYTDTAASRSVNALLADGCSFLPGGVLTRIDKRGAIEEGFAQTPFLYGAVGAAGGSLQASSTTSTLRYSRTAARIIDSRLLGSVKCCPSPSAQGRPR